MHQECERNQFRSKVKSRSSGSCCTVEGNLNASWRVRVHVIENLARRAQLEMTTVGVTIVLQELFVCGEVFTGCFPPCGSRPVEWLFDGFELRALIQCLK